MSVPGPGKGREEGQRLLSCSAGLLLPMPCPRSQSSDSQEGAGLLGQALGPQSPVLGSASSLDVATSLVRSLASGKWGGEMWGWCLRGEAASQPALSPPTLAGLESPLHATGRRIRGQRPS